MSHRDLRSTEAKTSSGPDLSDCISKATKLVGFGSSIILRKPFLSPVLRDCYWFSSQQLDLIRSELDVAGGVDSAILVDDDLNLSLKRGHDV